MPASPYAGTLCGLRRPVQSEPCLPPAPSIKMNKLYKSFSCGALLSACLLNAARAQDESTAPAAPEDWAVHGQLTNVTQKHARFNSPYQGQNSLDANGRAEETSDITLYAGLRLSPSTELWIDPEIDQGFGLSNTVGMAGFPSGEAYKIGADAPYFRVPRVFIRPVIALGTEQQKVDADANQLGGAKASDNLTITVGKFSVADIFDTNSYAHDPRGDFFNWSVIDAGAFDYAADSWGYTYGAALEWNQNGWSMRGGLFELSPEPNAKINRIGFGKYSLVGELEHRHTWMEHPGKIRFTTFLNRAPMGRYDDAVALAN